MTARKGTWTYAQPVALGNYYGTSVISVPFSTPLVATIPVLAEFLRTGTDPSGSRHLKSHASFVKVIGSGESLPASLAFGNLDLQSMDISTGSGVSKTKVFLFRVAKFDCLSSRVFNMKFWASRTTDFLTSNTHRILYEVHNDWQGDYSLPISYMMDRTKWLSTSLPHEPNLLRTGGNKTIHGSGDSHVSQWVYMAVAGSGILPLGQYGGTASNGFLVRVTYNVDNVFILKD